MKTTYAVQLIDPNQLIQSPYPWTANAETLTEALEFAEQIREVNEDKEYIIKLIISQTKE